MVFYLKISEMKAILQHTNNTRDTLLMRLLYNGPRVSDLVGDKKRSGLLFESIDWEEKSAKLKVKGGKDLVVVIDPDTLNLLKSYCELKGIKRGRIFKINRKRVHQIIKETAERAGLREGISAHKFRHSFAVHIIQGKHLFYPGKAGIRAVQQQLGHKSLKHTAIYLQFTVEDRKEAFGIE